MTQLCDKVQLNSHQGANIHRGTRAQQTPMMANDGRTKKRVTPYKSLAS